MVSSENAREAFKACLMKAQQIDALYCNIASLMSEK
jgi:hypothetical protein